jgi:flagellar hook-associated protein 1 FlgK
VARGGGGGSLVPIDEQISGGELGGLMGFRERMLDPTIDELGRIAMGVGEFVNQQHRAGFDLHGVAGGDFFQVGQPQWDAMGGTTGAIDLQIATDSAGNTLAGDLTGAEYELRYDGSSWSLTRTDNGQAVPMSGTGTAANPFIADGLRIEVPASPSAGDAFLLQPTRFAAADIGMALSDPAGIAASASGAPGDNGNALALANVFGEKRFAGGTESIEQAYQRLVGSTGTATRQAEVAAKAQQNLLEHSVARREAISGVNLDEEAANLLRYQQAYQAAAQVISVADQMFQTLLNATGR